MTKFRIWRFAFLQIVLHLFAAAAVGQAPVVAGEAFKLDSFGRMAQGDMKGRLDSFLHELSSRWKGGRGILVYYGTVSEINTRKRMLNEHLRLRNVPPSQLTIVRGGNVSDLRTDLWIVPAGAKPPRIEPEAFVAAEFGRVTKRQALAVMKKFFKEMNRLWDHQAFIIVYGNDAQMTMQEKWIIPEVAFVPSPIQGPRNTIVRGGKRKNGIGTVMWLLPPGAANPTP